MTYREITISVERRHITHGVRCNTGMCPIALAIVDCLRDGVRCSVGNTGVWLYGGVFSGHVLELPEEAQQFVRRFDRGAEVEPFSFTLQMPEEAL